MIPTQNGGVNYYRMAAWAFEMRKYRNVEVALFAFQYALNEPHPWQSDIVNNPIVRQHINSLCAQADIVIWHPVHYDHTLDFFMEMRAGHDKPFLVETDDNYIDVPQWNEGFHSYSPNSAYRRTALETIRHADGLIVTTPHLREIYSRFNDTIHIVENSLDFKGDRRFVGWDHVSVRKHRGVRMGWIGGRSHFADLMMAAPILREVLERNPDASLTLVNSALKPSCEATGKRYPFDALKVSCPDRSVSINRYAPFAASFGFDIGIAPLVDCNFNRSKSNLRWLEYSALKIPTVASNVGHFAYTLKHGVDGYLASGDIGWMESLNALIRDTALRERMGATAYRRVKRDFNVSKNAAKYVRLLKRLANFNAGTEEEWISQPSECLSAL